MVKNYGKKTRKFIYQTVFECIFVLCAGALRSTGQSLPTNKEIKKPTVISIVEQMLCMYKEGMAISA